MKPLYTIGYEGTDIDRFVATLEAVGVELLVDVRALPLSRKKGFSKSALRTRIEQEHLRYVHLGALGDPKEGRDAARAGEFARFRTVYTHHLSLAEPQKAIAELAKLAAERAACLMCFEKSPAECHRSIIASELSESFQVMHLFGDEPGRYVRNAAKLPGYRSRQGASAA